MVCLYRDQPVQAHDMAELISALKLPCKACWFTDRPALFEPIIGMIQELWVYDRVSYHLRFGTPRRVAEANKFKK